MLSREDIESFLIRSELDFQEIDDGIWLVFPAISEEAEEQPGIVVNHEPPVVVFRASLRKTPESEEEQLRLFRRLLELNAADLVHGAYGLEDGEVILGDTLELENLDFSEFRASLESLTLAVTSHFQQIMKD